MKFKSLLLVAILLVFSVFVFMLVYGCSRAVVEKPPVLSGVDTSPREPSAWIRFVKDDLVNVQITGTKTFITFRPAPEELDRFSSHINYLVPVRLECSKIKNNKECDYSLPYKLYISRNIVEPVKIEGAITID